MRTVASGAKRIFFVVHTFFIYTTFADPEGGGGAGVRPPPPKNHKNIGFLSNSSPDPLKNYEATDPAFNIVPSSACQRNAI